MHLQIFGLRNGVLKYANVHWKQTATQKLTAVTLQLNELVQQAWNLQLEVDSLHERWGLNCLPVLLDPRLVIAAVCSLIYGTHKPLA